jgi:hypothetical protein
MLNDAMSGRQESVQDWLDKGVSVHSVDFNTGNTMMHAAASLGRVPFGQFLLERGARVNGKNRRGDTPLHLSIEKRQDAFTQWLLSEGADPNVPNNVGKTPLSMAESTPAYHLELKEWILGLKARKHEEEASSGSAPPAAEELFVEDLPIFLKGSTSHKVRVTSKDTAQNVLELLAKFLQCSDIVKELELVEVTVGKETALAPNENLFERKSHWKSNNPEYWKVCVRRQLWILWRSLPSLTSPSFCDWFSLY